jgi:hypothetical protein
MTLMFRESSFNQPIGSWDVGNVGDMSIMFYNTPFNQPIGSWDVGNVTNMFAMFWFTPFNQDVSQWNVSGVTNMGSIFNSSGMNTTNYDALLTGWTGWNGTTATKTLQPNVSLGCSNCSYTSGGTAEAARNYLIPGLTWTITDRGGI